MNSITSLQPATRDQDNPPPEGGVAGHLPRQVLEEALRGHNDAAKTPDTGWENVVQANVTDTPEFGL